MSYEEYVSDYKDAMSIEDKTRRLEAFLEVCKKHPLRCAEAYMRCVELVDDHKIKCTYAKKASLIEVPSDGKVIDRSIYDWSALDQTCINGYYAEMYHDAIIAHNTLKERAHLIPEYYRDQCLKNGEFSVDHVASIHSLSRFQSTIRDLPKNLIGDTDIPNYFHFMWFKGDRTWMMIHYLAVLLVHRIQNPIAIYIYNDQQPTDNKWWELIKYIPTVHIIPITPPARINNKSIPWVQHKADVARVYTIYERGGVYVDADLLIYRNIQDLLIPGKTNMSYQDNKGIWNGFIAAPPRHPFMKKWIDSYIEKYGTDEVDFWAGLSINTPFDLSNQNPHMVALMPARTFLPIGWHDDSLYTDNNTSQWPNSFGIHLWETEAEKRGILPKDKDWFIQHPNTPFSRMFSSYIL